MKSSYWLFWWKCKQCKNTLELQIYFGCLQSWGSNKLIQARPTPSTTFHRPTYNNYLPTTMPHETTAENPFLSMRPSDSNLTVSLHPLVLLTVSDHITRHRVRGEAGPVVGALLGQQKGRETTIEHAFSCRAIPGPNGEVIMDVYWFEERLKQCMWWYSECPINIGYLLT